jgi:UDPglucose 6-dehydrogenase
MKLIVAGTGYVGLVQAAVCSEYGHEVYAYDVDEAKIEAFSTGQADEIEKFVMEPGLSNIIRETHGKTLFFSNDLDSIIEGTDAIFLCLPTPSNLDGSTNLTYFDAATEELAQIIAKRKDKRRVVITSKSTRKARLSIRLAGRIGWWLAVIMKLILRYFGACTPNL